MPADTEASARAAAPPALSVVLATADDFETIRKTVAHLDRQSVRNRLELVIVTASRERLGMDPAQAAGFAAHQVVELGAIESIGRANAAGVRQARERFRIPGLRGDGGQFFGADCCIPLQAAF